MTGNAPPPLRFSGQEEAFLSNSRLTPTVPPVESPNEGRDVSNLPEKVVGMETRVTVEANLQQQVNALQDRLGDLHVERGRIASSSRSPIDPHLSTEGIEEISALRQLVEDMRGFMHTLRAGDMRFSGLPPGALGPLDEPPPQYQAD